MRLGILALLMSVLLSGCSVMDHQITMQSLPPTQQYVIDKTKPDDYPSFLAAEGNDLSCRYGIHHESNEEFVPPKAQQFAALLAQALPPITSHKVVLQRFDVYYNHRLRALHKLGTGGIGGIVGAAIGESTDLAAHQNMGVVTFEKLLIDTKPEVDRYPGMNQVGCDNEHEGEYYPSEISGGHDVVVTWLKFTVDEQPYYFKTFYQFQPPDKAKINAGIKEAIQMSVKGVAKRIQL